MTTRHPSEAIRSSVRRPQRFPSQLQQPQQPQPYQQQQHHHLQYQQQQQQPQSTVHLQQPYQHQSFLFDTDFDLDGPLGVGLSAGSSAGNSNNSSNDHSNINNNNGGRGHSGGTNTKSSVVKSTPLTSAKPERADTKFDPIASMPGHNMSSFFGTSDDPLMATDTDAQPFYVDFGNANRFKKSASSTIGREPKKALVTPLQTPQPQESPSLGMLDDIFQPTLGIAAAPSRPIAKAAPVRERQLPQHKQQQQQQQQPPPPPLQKQSQTHQQLLQQQQHHDSSLDFFSSLDSLSQTRSTSSSSRTSPSASSAHLGSNAPLPSFPSVPADYSAFGRNNIARKTAPVRKPPQSNNTTSSAIKDTGSPLEAVSSSSAPLSALADVFVSNKGSELRPSSSLATSNTSSTGSRKKSDATMSMSASVTSSKSSASTLAPSAVSPAGQAVSKAPSRSTSSSNMSSTTSSPSASPSLAPVTAPPKPVPKMPARILNLPQHPTPTPLPTQNTSARIDPIVAPQRPHQQPPQLQQSQQQQPSQPPPPPPPFQQQQNLQQQLQQTQSQQQQQQSIHHSLLRDFEPQEQQPISHSAVPLSVPQPSPPPTGESQHVSRQDSNPPPQPSPHNSPPVQAPPQFPSSPWDDDDDDFYQAAIPPPPVVVPTVKAASRKVVEPLVQAPLKHIPSLKQTTMEQPQQPQPQQQQQQLKQLKQDYQKRDHPKLKQPAHQPPQPQPQPQLQPKQEQQQAPAKTRNQAPKPLAPEHDKALDAKHGHGTSSAPPMSPSVLSSDSLFMARYPPPPPSILYSDDQITVSSLHLTIHSFYFPLNTPVTIPLLTITEMDTLPSGNQPGGGNGGGGSGGGVTSWLKYKNWGENTPPLVYVVVRVEGEWLRKGFGVQQEQGVKVLKDAWKNVKENERGLRRLRPATMGMEEDDDGLMIEKPSGGQSLSNQSGGRIATGGDSGAEKRRWLNYQNTWTAYPFADDSPQFLAQQQRRGATSKAPRYHQQQPFLRSKPTAAAGVGNVYLGPEESCGDEPLFIDNDLNIHEEI
ncbi:hypothetical protein BG015_010800 [Linnemannia schmuckeri]|uniref:Uncharacterized protein n=1 Tax=Linnemannia schmuckeri TaxID=64567 RepID=A0A9P5RVZ8_9FUNG|nr:hypothetical protein BG015_010800 [Linnemannia schmuckeri]